MGLIATDFTDNFPRVRELLTNNNSKAKTTIEAAYVDNCRTAMALNELQAALSDCGESVEEAAGRRIDSAVSWLRSVIEADLKAVDAFKADTKAKACGAALQARNTDGHLLLQLCRVLWLVAAGAQPNVKNALGETALALAVRAATANH